MKERTVYTLGKTADFLEGEQTIVTVGKRELGIFKVKEQYFALPNICPHQIGPLCTGKISGTTDSQKESGWRLTYDREGEIITCPWHGMEFHIPTGQCLAFKEIRLRTFEIWVEGDELKVKV